VELPYSYKLSEEIARWAFEVHLQRVDAWHIAFTNPTAGPWKRLMANDADGSPGEVHRFLREDDRPDLVLVNDALEVLVIFEAKDRLDRLLDADQVVKSCAVVKTLALTLRGLGANPYWGDRAGYTVVPGLLWGAMEALPRSRWLEAFAIYEAGLAAVGFHHPGLVAVEARRSGDSVGLSGEAHGGGGSGLPARVLDSLEL
jgi:hypothetical protein